MYKKTTCHIEKDDLDKLAKIAMQRNQGAANIVYPSTLIRIAVREFVERYWREDQYRKD